MNRLFSSNLGWVFAVAFLVMPFGPVVLQAQETGPVIVLVRHAEKEAQPANDPPLTSRGADRAEALAEALRDFGLTTIYSTDYVRTQDTAAPAGSHLGLAVQSYDPGALADFAATLRGSRGRILVVGHSNTTPQLVELLGGDPGEPIVEATEYDRMYVLNLDAEGGVSTSVLRYGGRDH